MEWFLLNSSLRLGDSTISAVMHWWIADQQFSAHVGGLNLTAHRNQGRTTAYDSGQY
jgi:hypothetical protein